MAVEPSDLDLNRLFNDFAEAARHFIAVVTSPTASTGSHDTVEFLRHIEASLAELYRLALRLPDVEPETETDDDVPMNRRVSFETIADKLGPADRYWIVFDPTEQAEPVAGSLADDIYDVSHDLQKGLVVAERGGAISESVFAWRVLFNSHWGRHAVDALRAIHWRIHH